MRVLSVVVALVLTPFGALAAAQTKECMDLGPDKKPSWVLRSEDSRRTICAQHEALERMKKEERLDAVYKKRWRDAANSSVLPVTVTPISAEATGLALKPRLSDDGKILILMDEIRTPADQRQPAITLGLNAKTGSPQIQVAGEGIAPLATIAIGCPWSRRSVSLSDFSVESERQVASYEVHESIARMVRAETSCHIALARAMIPLPRDMVAVVWPIAPLK